MTRVEHWKEQLRNAGSIDIQDHPEERQIRKAVSELRKEGIIFLPIKHEYWRIDYVTSDKIEEYAQTQIAHLQTQYFNTLLPIKRYIKDEALRHKIGQLSFMDQL